ncbi:MAG TPA: hypothetical protein VM734_23380 [Kofleriaceae bacterium]|nr:hypothetical protein [Kofleriaceae bacterium]
MKRLVYLGLTLVGFVGCGDDDGGNNPIDARVADAEPTDADDTDATPVTYAGTLSLLEVQVLNPGTTGTVFGQGLQANISFTASDQVPPPVLEEQAGSPFGCKAWEFTPAQAAAASIGVDEGVVQMASASGLTPMNFPACVYQAGAGYICPHTNTQSTGGTIGAGQGGTMTLTDADVTYNSNNTTNRYVSISGATNTVNNGLFPVVGSPAGNTIVYVNPAGVAEELPATAVHINLAGIGPTPNAADPGFMTNDAAPTFSLTPGGGMHFDTFTVNTGTGTTGDDFELDTAEAIKLNAIPVDGSSFSIACSADECPAGSANGIILNIVTTDATITAATSPFVLPAPTTKRVQVRCAMLQGATAGQTITVPAAYSAKLMTSGATRIQATFIRPQLMASEPVTAITGHALVGFTNIAP